MPNARVAATVVAAALLAACGVQQSGLDANTGVTISGKAVAAGGAPLAGKRVVLVKELDLGEVVGGLFLTAASLGIACLADHPPAICQRNARVVTTDADGAFKFTLKGADTQGSFGLASTMEVLTQGTAVGGELEGGAAMAEFQVQTASLQLPNLRIWRPDVAWPTDDRPVWTALPADYAGSPSYSLEVYDSGGNPWWEADAARSGAHVDGRILEDVDGAFDVAAHARGTANGTTVSYTFVSGSRRLRGRAGAPPSRGAACAPVTTSGVGPPAPCALTAGSISKSGSQLAGASGVVVDLGADMTVSLVVVRGCTGRCTLATSSDMTSWSDAPAVSTTFATASLSPSRPARYVRVLTSDPTALRQLSVW